MFLGTTQLLDSLKGNDLLELIGLIRGFATADPFSSGSASGGMHVCPGSKPC